MITVEAPPCMHCQKSAVIELTTDEQDRFLAWQRGEIKFVQDAFPEWDADKRELLISGTHPACWEELFGDDEDEEGDEEDDWDRDEDE